MGNKKSKIHCEPHEQKRLMERPDVMALAEYLTSQMPRMTHYPASDALGYKVVSLMINGRPFENSIRAILTVQIPHTSRVVRDGNVAVLAWHAEGFETNKKYATDVLFTVGFSLVGTHQDLLVALERLADPNTDVSFVSYFDGQTPWRLEEFTRMDQSNEHLATCRCGLHFIPNFEGTHVYWKTPNKISRTFHFNTKRLQEFRTAYAKKNQ